MWQLLTPLIGKVIDHILPDPSVAAEAKLKMLELQQRGELATLDADLKITLAQLEINKEEAKSASIFVSGWRPAVGWTCGVALAYAAVFEPLLRFAAQVGFGYQGSFPTLDTDLTLQVLLGMLGLAGMRTFEKHQRAEHRR